MDSDPRLLLLHPGDDVMVLRTAVDAGEQLIVAGTGVVMTERLGIGQKIGCRPVRKGAPVIKYGAPIGRATTDIAVGDHVHLHNLASDYTPTYALGLGKETAS